MCFFWLHQFCPEGEGILSFRADMDSWRNGLLVKRWGSLVSWCVYPSSSGVPFSLQPLDPLCQAAREGLVNPVVRVDDDDDDDHDDDDHDDDDHDDHDDDK